MEDIFFQISGTYEGEYFSAEMYQGGRHEFFTLRWQEDEGQLHIRLIPRETESFEGKRSLILESVSLTFPWELRTENGEQETIFMNGYQSQTDSHEKRASEKENVWRRRGAGTVERYHLDRCGDYGFTQQADGAGQFHGFTYCYFRLGQHYRLLASLSERAGYTVFYYNGKAGQMRIEKDCRGLELSGEWNAFDLTELAGGEWEVFDTWFAQMGLAKPTAMPMTGYTSRYLSPQMVTESVLLEHLQAAVESGQEWDLFQIDDGYETAVGDWLAIDKEKFPNGMAEICSAVHDAGMKAGLWLAPFVCEKRSRCFREHPEWLVRDDSGQPLCFGGRERMLYVLDSTREEVRDYLWEVLECVLDEWEYDLVKLDLLFAASILPTRTKTRGQIMCEAMDFLRAAVGDKLLFAGGVPLGAAFGTADYCRVGCDVGSDWDGTWQERGLHRERTSTKNAIGNMIYRRQLDGRAFWNASDVYVLQEDSGKLRWKERSLLAQVSGLFGGLLMTSDHVGGYHGEQESLSREIKTLRQTTAAVRREKAKTVVEYEQDGEKKTLYIKV